MKIRIFFLLIVIFVSISSKSFSQVVETDDGKVEFIGLKTWEVQTLIDSVKSRNPNAPISFCAGDLVYELGFVDASAHTFSNEHYTIVTVIEPQDSLRVQYIATPKGSVILEPEWEKIRNIIKQNKRIIETGLAGYGHLLSGRKERAYSLISRFKIDSTQAKDIWTFIGEHKSAADRDYAYYILKNETDYYNIGLLL